MKVKKSVNGPSMRIPLSAGALLLLASAVNMQAQYNYTSFTVPGATSTYIYGISGNDLTGVYYVPSGPYSFLYDGSTYTTLDVPGSQPISTVANGVSGNNVVGYYDDGTENQGFLYDGSTYTTLTVPGSIQTFARGVDGNNVVGNYVDSMGNDQSFLYDGTGYTTLNVPGAQAGSTVAQGISGNDIVGYYNDSLGNTYGFLYDGSSYTTISVPGSVQITYANAISGNDILGSYYDGSTFHDYLYDGSTYTTISVPGAIVTQVTGISDGTIAGWYQTPEGDTLGFLATPVPEPSVWALAGLGAVVLWRRRRLKRLPQSV